MDNKYIELVGIDLYLLTYQFLTENKKSPMISIFCCSLPSIKALICRGDTQKQYTKTKTYFFAMLYNNAFMCHCIKTFSKKGRHSPQLGEILILFLFAVIAAFSE